MPLFYSIQLMIQAEQEAPKKEQEDDLQRYRWYKCFCDPTQYGRDFYFLHFDSQESKWDEPGEPYWIWDASKQGPDESGLQHPTISPALSTSDGPDPDYQGYDPRIHGNYDPNAPYAQYHKQKREQETAASQPASSIIQPGLDATYAAAANFNRFTGKFQTADKSVEQHDDYHKSGRQMGAFFDVDAAANAHGGRSLKEERRNQTLTGKQIKELAAKRRQKKEKKRMDFYKS
jgi:hypothetical protein